jgi:hypothetical protein
MAFQNIVKCLKLHPILLLLPFLTMIAKANFSNPNTEMRTYALFSVLLGFVTIGKNEHKEQ